MDKSLLQIIVCPACEGDVEEKEDKLICLSCKRRYPIKEGIPVLIEKFKTNLATQFSNSRSDEINSLCLDQSTLEKTVVSDFMNLLVAE